MRGASSSPPRLSRTTSDANLVNGDMNGTSIAVVSTLKITWNSATCICVFLDILPNSHTTSDLNIQINTVNTIVPIALNNR